MSNPTNDQITAGAAVLCPYCGKAEGMHDHAFPHPRSAPSPQIAEKVKDAELIELAKLAGYTFARTTTPGVELLAGNVEAHERLMHFGALAIAASRRAARGEVAAWEWAPSVKLAEDEVIFYSSIRRSEHGPIMTDSHQNSPWNVAAIFKRQADGVDWRNPVRILPIEPAATPAHASAGQAAPAPEGLRQAVYMALHYYMSVQEPNEWEATDAAIEAMQKYLAAQPAEVSAGQAGQVANKRSVIDIAARIFDFKPHKQTEETKAKYLRFANAALARGAGQAGQVATAWVTKRKDGSGYGAWVYSSEAEAEREKADNEAGDLYEVVGMCEVAAPTERAAAPASDGISQSAPTSAPVAHSVQSEKAAAANAGVQQPVAYISAESAALLKGIADRPENTSTTIRVHNRCDQWHGHTLPIYAGRTPAANAGGLAVDWRFRTKGARFWQVTKDAEFAATMGAHGNIEMEPLGVLANRAAATSTASLERDAARYRWLASGWTDAELDAAGASGEQPKDTPQRAVIDHLAAWYLDKKQTDDLIDAAMDADRAAAQEAGE